MASTRPAARPSMAELRSPPGEAGRAGGDECGLGGLQHLARLPRRLSISSFGPDHDAWAEGFAPRGVVAFVDSVAAEAAPTSGDGSPTPRRNTGSGPKLEMGVAPGKSGEVAFTNLRIHSIRPRRLGRGTQKLGHGWRLAPDRAEFSGRGDEGGYECHVPCFKKAPVTHPLPAGRERE